ncbi:MAG: sensor histidine kinase, partial [Anaerolineae bacterium]
EVDDDLPEVDIDADRISQVLRNLLTNAMRHTPEGGSVTITARLVGAGDPGVGSRAYGPTDDAGAGVADGTTYAAPDDAGHGLADGALDDAAHGANQGVADRATDSAAASRRFVRVAVTDTGEGIAPEDLSRVFDRFWRAEKSRSRDHGGSGLGLAIARQLIEAHGGAIGAMSVEGGGAELWFTVPVADATE